MRLTRVTRLLALLAAASTACAAVSGDGGANDEHVAQQKQAIQGGDVERPGIECTASGPQPQPPGSVAE